MKHFVSMLLVAAMLAGMLAGCGDPAGTAPEVQGSVEELIDRLLEERPVEFNGQVTVLDLKDTSEEGAWMRKDRTGLDSADKLAEAAAFEPLINVIAFSLVLVRVAPGEDAKAVAEQMKAGVNPNKWICVGADEVLAAGWSDVVMLVMTSGEDVGAQSFVDAFDKVAGMEHDFVLE